MRLMKVKFNFIVKLLAILCLFFVLFMSSLFLINSYLAKGLRGYQITGLSYEGREYEVRDGSVFKDGEKVHNPFTVFNLFRLASYHQEVVKNPILFSQNLATDEVSASFKSLSDDLVNYKKYRSIDENPIPISFLRSLYEGSVKYSNFLKVPSLLSAKELQNAYEKTQSLYQENLDVISRKVSALEEDASIIMVQSKSDVGVVKSDFDLMKKNSQKLLEEIEHRGKVLGGLTRYSVKGLAELPNIDEYPPTVQEYSLLNKEYLYYDKNNSSSLRGLYQTTTACFDGKYEPKIFYVMDSTYSGRNIIVPKIATNNFYEQVVTGHNMFQIFYDKGFEWAAIREANTYRCMENEYQVSLLALDSFLSTYKEPLMGEILKADLSNISAENKERLLNYAEIEESFYSSEIKSTEQLDYLADVYKFFAQVFEESGETEHSKMFYDRYLNIFSKITNFEKITNTSFYLPSYVFISKVENEEAPTAANDLYSYAIRSNYSVSFLNSSSLVWRLEERPKYYLHEPYPSEGRKTFLELSEQLGVEKLLEINRIFFSDQLKAININYPF